MKPRPFDYARPDTVDEAVALLAEHGDEARILAGGQSLMAMMNLRLADPAMLIDIARIAELGRHPRSRRQDRGRRRGDAEQAAGVARSENEAAAARRRPALRRPFPDPQQGHGLRLDRARRSELGNSAVARRPRRRGGAARQARRARAEGEGFPARHADHGARGRRVDRRGAVSGHMAAAWRSARWRGGTAISPSSRWRRWSRDDGSVRLGVGGMAATPVVRRIAPGGVKDARREARHASSKATRTCTPRRNCAATSCAISRPSSSRRPRQCAA